MNFAKVQKALTHSVLLLLSMLLLYSCDKDDAPVFDTWGKRPIYAPTSTLDDIRNDIQQPVEVTGPIYLLDTLFFMTEMKKGLHVYNVKDSLNVKYLTFFKIPAVTDFTISGDILYTDSWRDLLTIDISNIYQITLLNRQADAFNPSLFPPAHFGAFECVDESRGAVVDWEDADLTNAQCITN